MSQDHSNAIDNMFAYNLWANTQMVELCSTLTDEQLTVEVAGAYGRIKPTLVHLVGAEGFYVKRLTGDLPWPEEVDWDAASMSDLLRMVQQSGERLIEIGSQVDPATHHDVDRRGEPYRFYNWTVLLQALYHGIEHRTQIKILLTQLGVEHPELAAWDYTATLGTD